MKKYVIIVAGGAGVRMGSSVPKQFMPLGDRPLLMHTIEAFSAAGISNIIVVIPLNFIEFWESLCQEYTFMITHKVVPGGLFRSQSVKNGLDAIDETDAIVAVHDGVRPFVSLETINTAFQIAAENGTAVPYLDMKESLRALDGNTSHAMEREKFKTVQTPQCFAISVLRKVYASAQLRSFTDDAALVEQLNLPITLFKGNEENIKITTPLDMIIAEAILRTKLTV
jgi:2-C-methyl-D-erythritol 4-phosphate cytidylyltransferase